MENSAFNRTKGKKDNTNTKVNGLEMCIYALGIFLFISGTILYIWPNIQMLHLNHKFSKLIKEKNRLMERNRLLRIELESLKSFAEIEEKAIERGYIPPEAGQIVYVMTGKKEN